MQNAHCKECQMTPKQDLAETTDTPSDVVVFPIPSVGTTKNPAVAERDAAQRRVKAMNEAAKKLRDIDKGNRG